jgi:hypothetical protein
VCRTVTAGAAEKKTAQPAHEAEARCFVADDHHRLRLQQSLPRCSKRHPCVVASWRFSPADRPGRLMDLFILGGMRLPDRGKPRKMIQTSHGSIQESPGNGHGARKRDLSVSTLRLWPRKLRWHEQGFGLLHTGLSSSARTMTGSWRACCETSARCDTGRHGQVAGRRVRGVLAIMDTAQLQDRNRITSPSKTSPWASCRPGNGFLCRRE